MRTKSRAFAHGVRQMGDAYAIALFIGMPVYVLFLVSPFAASADGELRWVRALAAALAVTAVAVGLLELNRFI